MTIRKHSDNERRYIKYCCCHSVELMNSENVSFCKSINNMHYA